VDVKESDAAAAATAAVDGGDAASASTLAVPSAAATGNTVAIAVADDVAELPLTPELLGMEFKVRSSGDDIEHHGANPGP
jgi:hypothetical protein